MLASPLVRLPRSRDIGESRDRNAPVAIAGSLLFGWHVGPHQGGTTIHGAASWQGRDVDHFVGRKGLLYLTDCLTELIETPHMCWVSLVLHLPEADGRMASKLWGGSLSEPIRVWHVSLLRQKIGLSKVLMPLGHHGITDANLYLIQTSRSSAPHGVQVYRISVSLALSRSLFDFQHLLLL